MFLHESLLHIGFNMYALWAIGRVVEQYLGTVRYLGLYLVSGLAGSAGALLAAPLSPGLGASGAIFGILGAMMILEWQVTGRLAGQALALIVINLVISFTIPGISWGAHLGGLVGGILIMLSYAHWGDRGRATVRAARARRRDRARGRHGRQHRDRVLPHARLRLAAGLDVLAAVRLLQRRLRGGEAGERDAVRRAAHVVEPDPVAELDRGGLAAVLAADAELDLRLRLPPALDAIRIRSPTPSWSSTSNGFRSSTPSSR